MTPVADAAALLADEVARAARREGARRTLFLDLDGTLAPLVPDPARARIPAPTLEALRRLRDQGWRIVVVTGRPLAGARPLLLLRGVRIFGSHGAEGPWDGRRPPRPGAALRSRLRRLENRARRLARAVPGAYVERKPMGVGLHDRNVPAGRLRGWREDVRELLEDTDLSDLEVLRGRRITEVRPRGFHKGMVVDLLLRKNLPAGRDRSVVAIGDDHTDEDLFRALGDRGLSVHVGRPRTTRAGRRLASPAAVGRFLRRLAERSA